MRKVIWKSELGLTGNAVIQMPVGAELLDVQTQSGMPCLWFKCEPNLDKESRAFSYYGTGHNLPDNEGEYVGTFQMANGEMIFHLHETT